MNNHGNCGRPWTPREDDLLKAAVAIYGDNTEKWKTIALSVPGRTNKACRKRWLHSLSPSIKKSAWTREEDQLLLSLFEKHPNKWSRIAREIPGRTDDACSKRYREALDPNLKKDGWSDEEDRRLLDTLMRYGGLTNPKWGLIGQELRRSGLGCRNRWRLLERKRKAALRQNSTSQTPTGPADVVPQLPTDIWPLFAESESSYWTSVFDTLGVTLENFAEPEGISRPRMMNPGGVGTEEPHRGSMVTEPGLNESDVTVGQHSDALMASETSPFLHARSAPRVSFLPTSGPEPGISQPATRSSERTLLVVPSPSDNESAGYSFEVSASDTVDYDASQDDVYRPYDDDPRSSSTTDEAGTHGVSEEPCILVEAPSEVETANKRVTHEAENLSSLGTLAHAASTLSPSPCAPSVPPGQEQIQQAIHDIVVPPRKRRRTIADSPAFAGMHVITDIGRKQKTPPKLSSTLPAAGDSSNLAYVCGHSVCFPPGASASIARYATSGELLNHYKDRHMATAGTGDEIPFRCGLSGCNKRWKSINGLQYHLQISKVHYQHVCSRVTSGKKNTADHDSGTDNTVARSSDGTTRNDARRLHKCPHPRCLKEYKQLSGLRYHLLHGHPKDVPAQLTTIPPRIAKELCGEPATDLPIDTLSA